MSKGKSGNSILLISKSVQLQCQPLMLEVKIGLLADPPLTSPPHPAHFKYFLSIKNSNGPLPPSKFPPKTQVALHLKPSLKDILSYWVILGN